MKSEFAERLRNARLDLRLRQEDLAKKWGFSDGNYIYMLESGKKPFPRHLQEKVLELERAVARREEKTNPMLAERGMDYASEELDEQALHIALNLIFDKLGPREINQLIKEINDHPRIQQPAKRFWIHVLTDWLQIKLASGTETVTTVTRHGIVREEHKDLRGVSSKVAEKVKGAGAAAAQAAFETSKLQTSSKPASPSGNKPERTDPTHPGQGPSSGPPKPAPK